MGLDASSSTLINIISGRGDYEAFLLDKESAVFTVDCFNTIRFL